MIRSELATRFILSPNVGARVGSQQPDILLLHYTGMASAEQACQWLCNSQSGVSCHYLVDEVGVVTQMVDESLRAWHAGVASWGGESDINSRSIGIEIHNGGHQLGYHNFSVRQMQSVTALCRQIVERHGIAPARVLAHSDVAPLRKMDPGEKFDWSMLHQEGVGHWVAPVALAEGAAVKLGDSGQQVTDLQDGLRRYGYGIEVNGIYDSNTAACVTAFQRHFRPERVDGMADFSTTETLARLLAGQ